MNQLSIPFLQHTASNDNLPVIAALLDRLEKHRLSFAPWKAYPYKPEVEFSIAHSAECLLIKFYVKEKEIRALNTQYNSPVYEDSCVECFISFDADTAYYNLEINCTGTILLAYGHGRSDRNYITEQKLKKIGRQVLITHDTETGLISWELTVVLPIEVFAHHSIASLTGRKCRGNFYKCGDLLAQPHFLSWNDIKSEAPDFHLPEFFGRLEFE
jgi:hypothetical protein